eukprot:11689827-Alexandrium_andersonii.AAC.1
MFACSVASGFGARPATSGGDSPLGQYPPRVRARCPPGSKPKVSDSAVLRSRRNASTASAKRRRA